METTAITKPGPIWRMMEHPHHYTVMIGRSDTWFCPFTLFISSDITLNFCLGASFTGTLTIFDLIPTSYSTGSDLKFYGKLKTAQLSPDSKTASVQQTPGRYSLVIFDFFSFEFN